MKALTTAGLTKLIQLIKSSFISVNDTVTTTTVTLADVATSGSYNDLSNKPTEIPSQSGQSGKFLTTNGTAVSWGTPTDTTYDVFTGANGTVAGSTGLVPQPLATDNTKFLKGDGTWSSSSTWTYNSSTENLTIN